MSLRTFVTRMERFETILFFFTDIVAICISVILAGYARVWLGSVFQLVPFTYGAFVFLAKIWVVVLVITVIGYYGGYSIIINFWDDVLIITKSLFITFLLTWMILSLQKEAETVSRIAVSLAFLNMGIIIPTMRFFTKLILYKALDARKEAILLGPTGERENRVVQLFNNEWYSGYRITRTISGEDNTEINADICFMPIWNAQNGTVKDIKMGVKNLILITDISGLPFMNSQVKTFLSEHVAIITSDNGLLSPQKVAVKRVSDIVFSVICLCLFLPLFLLTMFFIKIESKGPVLFKHKRCGRNLVEFDMLKFRTMRSDADGLLERYVRENQEAQEDWIKKNKIKNDPRITNVGKILRKTSLDELPQLLNVIKGDMSIVGPRPDTKEALTNFYEEYREIYSRVKPGITGLWQVSGRSDLDYEKRVKLDYLYVLNWSLWLDFVIMLKTFRAILSGQGAY